MKRIFSIFVTCFSMAAILMPLAVKAQDSVIVKTLTFDDIYKRKGTWKFPSPQEKFSKILMKYTLKCDPKTAHDQYNCGEWDYLTYTVLHKKTGTLDSVSNSKYMYMAYENTGDKIKYAEGPFYDKYITKKYDIVYNKINSENSYTIGTPGIINSNVFSGKKGYHVSQIFWRAAELNAAGLSAGNIDKIKFDFASSGNTFENLQIRVKPASGLNLSHFDNSDFETVYFNDKTISAVGINEFNFYKPYNWDGVSSLIVEISYTNPVDVADMNIQAESSKFNSVVNASKDGNYIYFDGKSDFIDAGNIEELNNADKVTFETWINIQSWEAWNQVFGKAGKFGIELGESIGEIYCLQRPEDNTYGKVKTIIVPGYWYHIAMVFDGKQINNSDRIKFYINGVKQTLQFNNDVLSNTFSSNEHLLFSSIENKTSAINAEYDNTRIWKEALDQPLIETWMNKDVDNTHPNYSNLLLSYNYDEDDAYLVLDKSPNAFNGKIYGYAKKIKYASTNDFTAEFSVSKDRPVVAFVQGDYDSDIQENMTVDSVYTKQMTIEKYKVGNYSLEIDDVLNVWSAGWSYTYVNGNKADSAYHNTNKEITNSKITYYSLPKEKFEQFEIGRFITPYGINFDLGPNGFTWYYDVTDYGNLLRDSVTLSSANLQELIDLQFIFIKGEPSRDVIEINKIWGDYASYLYGDMASDKVLSKKAVAINPDAKNFWIRTRLTGHGHKSSNGNPPWCCEWKQNNHYFFVNDEQVYKWGIYKTIECATNPTGHQGGTWVYPREGWCPGDVVNDVQFDITQYVKSNSVNLDYSIDPVPSNNPGMADGNYIVSMELFQYSDYKRKLDAEIFNIMSPTKSDYYKSSNPNCVEPKIVIRNLGSDVLNSLNIHFQVSGGMEKVYNWHGNLKPMQTEEVSLYVEENKFWIGDDKHEFHVWLTGQNGQEADEYAANDAAVSLFDLPPVYNGKIVLEVKTNNVANENAYNIYDISGELVRSVSFSKNNTVYTDTLDLPFGCYTLDLTDQGLDGMDFWANPDAGAGSVKITDASGNTLKYFDPDFGYRILYAFTIGGFSNVDSKDSEIFAKIYPNPNSGSFNLDMQGYYGNFNIEVVNMLGQKLITDKFNCGGISHHKFNMPSGTASGVYYVKIFNEKTTINTTMIVN